MQNFNTKKRKLAATTTNTQANVTNHYNSLPYHTREQFQKSSISHLKKLNSWAKACLINAYVKSNDSVLELCAGKGGDAAKYDNNMIQAKEVIWMDVAENSIREAHKRITTDNRSYKSTFIVGDCFQVDIKQVINLNTRLFDVISCQMAFHYCFENEIKARCMLYNISKSLKNNGYFIGTLPNYNFIRKKLLLNKFQNSVVSIVYDCFPVFGARYIFNLKEAISNCPEYLVHMGSLKILALEYGLEYITSEPFHKFYQKNMKIDNNKKLYQKMRIPIYNELDNDQWEAHGIYQTMIFKKIENYTIKKDAIDKAIYINHHIKIDNKTGIKICTLSK